VGKDLDFRPVGFIPPGEAQSDYSLELGDFELLKREFSNPYQWYAYELVLRGYRRALRNQGVELPVKEVDVSALEIHQAFCQRVAVDFGDIALIVVRNWGIFSNEDLGEIISQLNHVSLLNVDSLWTKCFWQDLGKEIQEQQMAIWNLIPPLVFNQSS